MSRKLIILGLIILYVFGYIYFFNKNNFKKLIDQTDNQGLQGLQTDDQVEEVTHPLSIEFLRNQEFPGSEIAIEQNLPKGSNYKQYVASYRSEGLKIYALLTIPGGDRPEKVGQ